MGKKVEDLIFIAIFAGFGERRSSILKSAGGVVGHLRIEWGW